MDLSDSDRGERRKWVNLKPAIVLQETVIRIVTLNVMFEIF